MPNVSRPEGFRPHGEVKRLSKYIAAGAIYPGDLVSQEAGGRVAAASATSALIGAAAGYAAAAGDVIMVYDHPEQMLVAQADDATIDAQTDLGLNYDIVAAAADTSYRVSRMQIDASTQATTATLPIKALRLDEKPDNALGSVVKVVCKINNHQLAGGTGTAGV